MLAPATIAIADASVSVLAEYATIPIRYEVQSVMSAVKRGDGRYDLTEQTIAVPYFKDYDTYPPDRPQSWSGRFDTSNWVVLLARGQGALLGGATIAWKTSGLDVLEGRNDLAVLWDIRVSPAARGRGVGCALFVAAEQWAMGQGCRELRVETQDVNVPACRFYLAMGCALRSVHRDVYPECPHEVQYFWTKGLTG